MADLDADGRHDLVSGSYSGEIYWFRRKPNGTFAAPEALKAGSGKLNVGRAAAVAVTDWDGDGDLDLVVGTIQGQVWLVTNTGTPKQPAFSRRERLQAAGKDLVAERRNAGPCVADWDGDGLADLLVGAGSGAVVWYRNVGSRSAPRLAAGVTLVEAFGSHEVLTAAPARSALRAKPAVADWNGDGRPDLLVGDFWSGSANGDRTTHGGVWVYPRTDPLLADVPPAADRPARSVGRAGETDGDLRP